VLGKMPNKTFKYERQQPVHQAFSIPEVRLATNSACVTRRLQLVM